MARYERDYGRDYGGWRQQWPPYSGGMRSDGWGTPTSWRNFPGEEGWFGEGYEGMPGIGYDPEYGSPAQRGARGGHYGRPGSFERQRVADLFGDEYDFDYGREFRAGTRWDARYPSRSMGYGSDYGAGWQDYGRSGKAGIRGSSFGRGREMRASEIMTEDPQAATPDATLSDVAKQMRDLDVGIIPVVDDTDGRRLQGVITDRDIAVRAIAEGKDGSAKVADCMSRNVRTVNKNDSVRDVMRVMRQEQVRRVPVTDREGRLVGIIAQADLAVDYGGMDRDREVEVGEMLERISEPAEPQTAGMTASGRSSGKKEGVRTGSSRSRSRKTG